MGVSGLPRARRAPARAPPCFVSQPCLEAYGASPITTRASRLFPFGRAKLLSFSAAEVWNSPARSFRNLSGPPGEIISEFLKF